MIQATAQIIVACIGLGGINHIPTSNLPANIQVCQIARDQVLHQTPPKPAVLQYQRAFLDERTAILIESSDLHKSEAILSEAALIDNTLEASATNRISRHEAQIGKHRIMVRLIADANRTIKNQR